jgi:hypothetical protein
MASKTKKLELIRKNRNSKMGQKRKSKNRNEGTTKTQKELFGDK